MATLLTAQNFSGWPAVLAWRSLLEMLLYGAEIVRGVTRRHPQEGYAETPCLTEAGIYQMEASLRCCLVPDGPSFFSATTAFYYQMKTITMHTQQFAGKTAIITGAGNGIGFAIAEYLIGQQANVVINDIDPTMARAAAGQLNQQRAGRAYAYPGDAGDVGFIRDMVRFAAAIQGARLEMVVANAGLTEFGDFFAMQPAEFDRVVRLNLKGTFFLAQAAAAQMKQQGSGGNIVLIGSNVGARAYGNLAAYGMTKAGISGLAKQLTLPLGPLGISVNCLSPGATLTERTKEEEPDYAGVWSVLNPNGRVGKPEDIAVTAGFLLSPAARHITGQTLLVDGGWTAYGPSPAFLEKAAKGIPESSPVNGRPRVTSKVLNGRDAKKR